MISTSTPLKSGEGAGGALTIAVDAMGGYHAPEAVVSAVARLSMRRRVENPAFFLLVGDEVRLTELLLQTSHNPERIHISHAPTTVGMGEPAQGTMQRHPKSSIAEACRLCARGQADAVVTAGNPGAAVLAAVHNFKLLPGVHYAALAAVYPTPRTRGGAHDPFSLILDVGAALRVGAQDLVTFALMGSAYARIVSDNARPRVALLSNSKEPALGIPAVREATELLQQRADIHFMGNIEGRDIPSGLVDVIVCEGFVGDVAIKILEGVREAAFELARAAYRERLVWKVGLELLSSGLGRVKELTDFKEYGGAPLLGVDRVMILAHPTSEQRAIENAIKLAIKNVRADLPRRIGEALATQTPVAGGAQPAAAQVARDSEALDE